MWPRPVGGQRDQAGQLGASRLITARTRRDGRGHTPLGHTRSPALGTGPGASAARRRVHLTGTRPAGVVGCGACPRSHGCVVSWRPPCATSSAPSRPHRAAWACRPRRGPAPPSPPGPRVFSRPRVHHDGVAGVAWNVPAVVVAPMRRRPRRGIGGPSRHAMAGAAAVPQAWHPHDWSDSLICYERCAVEQERTLPVLMMRDRPSNRGMA
jgi:hypothetical protein